MKCCVTQPTTTSQWMCSEVGKGFMMIVNFIQQCPILFWTNITGTQKVLNIRCSQRLQFDQPGLARVVSIQMGIWILEHCKQLQFLLDLILESCSLFVTNCFPAQLGGLISPPAKSSCEVQCPQFIFKMERDYEKLS